MFDHIACWSNLRGVPARTAEKPLCGYRKPFEGKVKFRLCHSKGRSFLLPEVLFGFQDEKFFIPSFFGPPMLKFNVPRFGSRERYSAMEFNIDVASPCSNIAIRLHVYVESSWYIRSYEDGAQLYRCLYSPPLNKPLKNHVAGSCKMMSDGDFCLHLYHHTTKEAAESILSTKELWASKKNISGTENLNNVSSVYFTSIDNINNDANLTRVAMSQRGAINYQTTSNLDRELVLSLDVLQASPAGRSVALEFWIPTKLLSPAHLLFHMMTDYSPAYYEVVGPEIFRVPLQPGATLGIDGDLVSEDLSIIRRFDYIVEGDASRINGLRAPMRENDVEQIAKIEHLSESNKVFDFWIANANTDQFTGRVSDFRLLES